MTPPTLTAAELASLREMVKYSYSSAILDAGIELYGRHADIFTKARRLLPDYDVDEIKAMPFMHKLRDDLGAFTLATVILPDGTQTPREEIYWRIVRPNEPSDVGPAHRDRDFHAQYGILEGVDTRKVWIPLWAEENCGLRVHDTIVWEPGTMAVFDADTVHQGVVNRGKSARVSMEITLVLA